MFFVYDNTMIMKECFNQLNQRLLSSLNNRYPIGLAHGRVGVSIYFYHLSRLEGNMDYQVIAKQIFDRSLLSADPVVCHTLSK